MTSQIEFRDVHRSFGDQEVLRGLSFSVKPGHIHAFLGRNGAGKTTALRILLGFWSPTTGLPGLLMFLVVERRRAWSIAPVSAIDRALLIRSA